MRLLYVWEQMPGIAPRIIATLVTVAALILAHAGAAPEQRFLRVWDRDVLGANARAWTVVPGPDGAMYVGANAVLRFDGDQWQSLPVGSAYAVRTIAFGADGKMWVGAFGEAGFFTRTASGWSEFHSLVHALPPDLPLGDVWHVFPEGAGAVFVTKTHVLRWNGHAWQSWQFGGERRLPASRIRGEIWFQHASTGLWILRRDGPELRLPRERLPEGMGVVNLIESQRGEIVLVSSIGLYHLDHDEVRPWGKQLAEFTSRANPTAVTRLHDGRLAVATLNGGVGLISADGASLEVIDHENGLPSRNVLNIATDTERHLWLAQSAHLTVLDPKTGVAVFRDPLLPLEGLQAIESLGARTFLATDDGLFQRTESDSAATVESPQRYTDLLACPYGLLASRSRGVDLITAHGTQEVFISKSDVIRLSAFPASDTWLVDDSFALRRLERKSDGTWQQTLLANIPDIVTSVAIESETALWVGTFGGQLLHLTRDSEWRVAHVTLPSATNGALLTTRVGSTTLAFSNRGAFRRNATGAWVPLAGLPALPVTAQTRPGGDGAVWIALDGPFTDGERAGLLACLRPSTGGDITVRLQPLPAATVAGSIRRMHVDAGGDLWLGGTKAVLRLRPGAISAAPRAPTLRAETGDGALLRFGEGAYRCEFASGEFLERNNLRFQTWLTGVDREWSPPTNQASVAFSGLREGDYTLRVRTIDVLGRTSEAATRSFTILPPWHRTWWAQGAGVLLLAAGVLVAVQLRHRRAVRRTAELERAVADKTAELTKANAAKSEFIANMSHEIRHPISGILGLAVALEDSPLTADQREWVRSIKSCGYLLGSLVEEVLDLARIEARKLVFESAPFRPADLLATCVAMLSARAAETRSPLRVVAGAEAELCYLGDAPKLQQIVLNFLSNALKFAPGREIEVTFTRTSTGRGRFAVRDQGPGIAAADAERLFTRFTRLENRAQVPGLGLGLALCRELARGMQGEVGVESAPGRGSRFFLEVPLEAAVIVEVRTATGLGGARRALIVDDIAYAATATAAVVRRVGFRTSIAHRPEQALELFGREAFDLVLLDWDLGAGLGGLELVRVLRQREPATQRAVFVAATAHATPEHRERSLAGGFDLFLTKPITPEKLAAALEPLLRSLRPAAPVLASTEPRERDEVLNLQLLETLGDHTPQGTVEQITRFFGELEENLGQLRAALAAGDPPASQQASHRLAGNGRMIAADELVAVAERIYALAGNTEAQQRELGAVEAAVNALRLSLEEYGAALRSR